MLNPEIIRFEKITKGILSMKYIIPDIQREIDDNHVKEIYDYQNEIYEKINQYIFSGTISIAVVDFNEYLIDGQHRLTVYSMLNEKYPERLIDVTVDYYYCKSYQDVELLYKNVNTFKINNISKMGISSYKIIKELREYFNNNFKSYLSNSSNPRKPNINLDKLISEIENKSVIEKASIQSGKDFIERINVLNLFYSKCSNKQFEKWNVKNIDQILIKIKNSSNNFYFGLYTNFEYLDRIIDSYQTKKTYNQLNHYSSTYRTKITKDLRGKVWNSFYKTIEGNCYVCNDLILNTDFECGHCLSVARGGETTLSNLKPVCRLCNCNCGTDDLEDYKNMYYKQNF